jgi:hypothetical protein
MNADRYGNASDDEDDYVRRVYVWGASGPEVEKYYILEAHMTLKTT